MFARASSVRLWELWRTNEHWLTDAGFTMRQSLDWTDQVSRTWEICRDRVRRLGYSFHRQSRDPGQIIFIDRFQTILDAYNSKAMRYGCFIAEKPL